MKAILVTFLLFGVIATVFCSYANNQVVNNNYNNLPLNSAGYALNNPANYGRNYGSCKPLGKSFSSSKHTHLSSFEHTHLSSSIKIQELRLKTLLTAVHSLLLPSIDPTWTSVAWPKVSCLFNLSVSSTYLPLQLVERSPAQSFWPSSLLINRTIL